ncbi:hypothetical protein [Neobacillus sp. NPDC093127]|uniref:hypothetical protein n=1 Tax=Neobacillus sp. NPDC093127 TaxID=3364296 RepID=UPI00382E7791
MNIFRQGSAIIAMLMLFGGAMSAFYYASVDITEYFKDPSRDYLFEVNVVPFILFFVIGGLLTFFSYRKKKGQNKNFAKIFWLPDEFEEKDEREQQITARACRAAYISMLYAFPIITALLLLYPFISKVVPYYPILVFTLLPLTQIMTYLISWQKNNK